MNVGQYFQYFVLMQFELVKNFQDSYILGASLPKNMHKLQHVFLHLSRSLLEQADILGCVHIAGDSLWKTSLVQSQNCHRLVASC